MKTKVVHGLSSAIINWASVLIPLYKMEGKLQMLNFLYSFTEVCSLECDWWEIINGLNMSLATNMSQSIF